MNVLKKLCRADDGYWGTGVHSFKAEEFEIVELLSRYVDFYNRQRPCFAIGYDTPDNYCKRFYRGELEHRDTFSQRVLSEKPKFVQKRKERKK